MASETFGSLAVQEKAPSQRGRRIQPPLQKQEGPKRSEFFRTFRKVWTLTKAWTRDFDRRLPTEKEFLEAAETRLEEVNAFSYPEAACRGPLILLGKHQPFEFETISSGMINQLTYKKAAEMQWEKHEVSEYCRSLRGLRGLLMHEFAHESHAHLLEGAKEIFPELEGKFPPGPGIYSDMMTGHLKTIFEVMLYGLKQKAESEDQFSQAAARFFPMLLRESEVQSLQEWIYAMDTQD
ncbi:MAG: hypothetical protein GY852_06475 [bacterium]|nr:hypothetical protein [bacterium]